jgi:cyclohexa-1,5-dienecarbonyl-CoA hydratase
MKDANLATLKVADDVIRLTMSRAPLNFLSLQMLRRLQDLLESMGDYPPGRILVLDSDCAAFSAGLEMTEQTPDAIFLLLDQYHAVIHALNSFPRPTIAMVRGVALGAGNELAICCDFVLASLQSTFGQPEIKVGTIPSVAPLLLPQRIGAQRALQMMLTGTLVDAREAEQIGLIYRALPEDALEPALAELAHGLGGSSEAVMQLALRAARGARTRELENHLREVQSLWLNELMELADTTEGIRAFIEKRTPQWKNR